MTSIKIGSIDLFLEGLDKTGVLVLEEYTEIPEILLCDLIQFNSL